MSRTILNPQTKNVTVTSGKVAATGNTYISHQSFEYTGEAGLIVIGSVSGKQYRFSKTGATQLIDSSDTLDMSRLYLLRKLN